ncbi:MAG: RsmE family RNA methyltransferase [Bacteroidota bacterium]
MQLFYDPDANEGYHQLSDAESKHLIRVLRKREGEVIHLTDGKGHLYQSTILEAGKRVVLNCQLEEKKQPNHTPIHMIVCPTKSADRIEWFIEKAVELGVTSITPLISSNSERRKVKIERWQKVAISAMKQSLKFNLPIIHDPIDIWDLLAESESWEGRKLLFHCRNSKKSNFKEVLEKDDEMHFLIGPEGDFTADEVSVATDMGWISTTLGDRRLRTETAAISALDGFHWFQNWMT